MVLLSALPLAGPVAALPVGLPPDRLYDSVPSRVLASVGVALTAAGWWWVEWLLRRAGRPGRTNGDPCDRGGGGRRSGRARLAGPRRVGVAPPSSPSRRCRGGHGHDEVLAALGLVAAALRSGVGAVEALEAVAAVDAGPAGHDSPVVAAAHRWGQYPTRHGPIRVGWAAAAVAWHAAHSAGAAPAGLLTAASGRMRAEESRRVEAAVHRAGVLLVLPLGVCFLPGFVATTVAPVVLHLLGGVAR